MKKLRSLLVTALAGMSVIHGHAALVGAGGYTNDFSTLPPAADWSHSTVGAGSTEIGSEAQMETAVQLLSAANFTAQLAADAGNPPGAGVTGVWSSSGNYVQTRPTGNAATFLMCKLVNNLDVEAIGVAISYDFATVQVLAEQVPAHRVFYSLSGAPNTWVPIQSLSGQNPGTLTANLSLNWASGASLFIVWADDNADVSTPDTAMQIDNFSVIATPGTQVPVSITAQPQSLNVDELSPASFTVGLTGYLPPTVQWYSNDIAIPDATNLTYSIESTPLSFQGLQFKAIAQNVASNVTYYATSSVATLTVNADAVAPTLVSAQPSGLAQVLISFSERLALGSATNIGNYAVTSPSGNLTISNIVLDATATNVILFVSTMTPGATYTVTINDVTDLSAAANVIPANSQAQFVAAAITYADIGSPALGGNVVAGGNGYNVIGSGTNIFGGLDQFTFAYEPVAGNFDKKVRVQSFTGFDAYAMAGLMARENLNPNSPFAASMATPSIAGCYMLQRTAAGANTSFGASFPANYPHTWLRLSRVGNTFTAYAGYDGQTWEQLGTVTIAMPTSIFLGYAVCGASENVTATAELRDIGSVVGGTVVANLNRNIEPLGPSTRRTPLVISEVMYHPKARPDGRNLAFIEIFNSGLTFEDLSGFRIGGDVSFTFPQGTIIQAGGFIVVAAAPGDMIAVHGLANIFGPFGGVLSKSAGNVYLYNNHGALLVEVEYETSAPWPIAADGTGHSLALVRPSYGERDVRAWGISDLAGGSPGRADSMGPEPLRNLRINEFLARTVPPAQDFIEIYNYGNTALNISGAWLTDAADTNKFRIPDGTVIPARGFAVFNETQLGFGLSSSGERIFLVNSNQNRVLDAWRFDAQSSNSVGRFPDGAEMFSELSAQTPGATNAPIFRHDIVINEIMYDPITNDDNDEFIEIHNRGSSTVDISRWRFTDGIDFSFPPNTLMPAGAHFVVAKNRNRLLSNHPGVNPAVVFGDYDGTLRNRGERVAFAQRIPVVVTNGGIVATNSDYLLVSEVSYGPGGQWGEWAHGGGSSLELKDPDADTRLASNWGDSDETMKSTWTVIENVDGLLDNGQGAINELQIMLIGRGECLVDNLEVTNTTGANLLPNSTFESGLNSWLLGGNHIRSSLENEGYFSARSLRLRASSGGDNGANRVESDLTTTLADGQRATIRGRFRWLRGNPHALMKFHGNQLEAAGRMQVPSNLGSPGAVNSIRVNNAGPAILDVAHSPVLPAASQAVVVRATASDPDGLQSLTLRYRVDPSMTFNSVNMVDNGTGGDAVAGDGIYSATIPGQSAGVLVAFHVLAVDAAAPPATNTFPINPPAKECHVRFGDPATLGAVVAYRLWMSSSNINHWGARERLSNEPLDSTFVYGNIRAIYGAGGRYRGSPFLRPSYNGPLNNRCAYVWTLPEDQSFLNTDELNLDSMEPADRDPTVLRELTAFSIAEKLGLSFSYQRYVHVVMNGVTDTSRNIPAYTDVQQPNGDYIDSWFPDKNVGDIFKVDDWFEFNDNLQGPDREFNIDAQLRNFITPGGATSTPGGTKKQARYRWSWEKKVLGGLDDDYSMLFALVDALNAADPLYTQQTEGYVDVEKWMTQICVRHIVGDWDGYGYNRGKNTFAYKPRNGKWELLLWDLDFALGCSGGHPPTQSMFDSQDPTMQKMLNHPPFRRIYFRAMQRAADGPLQSAVYMPLLQARYNALRAAGINPTSPFVGSGAQGISIPAWIDQRRANLLSQIPSAVFGVSSPTVNSSSNAVVITGTAPVGVQTIIFNGVEYPVTWTGVTTWSARIPVFAPSTQIQIAGKDVNGNVITTTNTVTATVTVGNTNPVGQVVFNEIMSRPLVPMAEYIELFNTSTTVTFDVSGWEINGAGYTFPAGTVMPPRSFLLLARDRVAFWTAHGYSVNVFDVFPGNLQAGGETLSLIIPAANTNQPDVIVDRVRYDNNLPWPGNEAPGSSYQLVDSSQDNVRVGNWYASTTPAVYSPEISTPAGVRDGWRFFSATGSISIGEQQGTNSSNTFRLLLFLGEPGSAIIDDLSLVSGTEPAVGHNYIRNGDFESPLDTTETNSWKIGTNGYGNTFINSDLVHSGNGAFKIVGTNAAGSANPPLYNRTIMQVISPVSAQGSPLANSTNTLSFWYWATNSATNLYVRIRNSAALSTGPSSSPTNINIFITPSNYVPPQLIAPASNSYSPGTINQTAGALPTFQPLWINELQADNASGIMDNQGEREPWIEIYNAGTNTVSLEGLYLSANYTNLTNWAFPPGSSIGPTQFLVVICDGEAGETAGAEYHTSFRLPLTGGSVALSRIHNGQPQVLDYVNFPVVAADLSYGSFPDGQPFDRQVFQYVTPGGTNDGRTPPIVIYINEWMAGNVSVLADPADGNFEDWFELYNPGNTDVNLAGYYLTDTLGDPTKYLITTNGAHIVPANGYLLVWADNEVNQNTVAGVPRPDLHVNFALSLSGESIGLFALDGSAVDTVTFFGQPNDASMGRFPDGAPELHFFFDTISPRAPNYLEASDNTPPVLNPIGNKVLFIGQSLAFTATATDNDVPAQSLTFSLTGPVPGGASITPGGAFTWTPATIGTNNITVRVVDNGVPAMNDSETISVEVLGAPGFTSSVQNGNHLELTWGTRAGKRYAVDYKSDLNAAQWTPLWTNLASGTSMTFTNATTNAPQRFFRIRTVD